MNIELTDNNFWLKDGRTVHSNNVKTFDRKEVSALFPFADKRIANLCRENENLLLFPYSIADTKDKIGDSPILSILNTKDSEKVFISTGNIMGFIGVGDLKIKIKSRFDEGRDDFFLHYMLQRVLSFNLFDLSHNNEQEDVFDFVMFMFPYLLKDALRQGVYREYQHFRHNDANVKGTINVGRHIARNIPFLGNIAYSTREYSHDNSMTQLIRHTIEFMKTKKYGMAVLEIDRDTVDNVKTIIQHTTSYDKNQRGSIISRNLRMKTHPYYTAYQPLQALCLQILRMEELRYGENEDEICGILFDGAWLWEEYVNSVMKEYQMGFIHPENKSGKGGFYLFDDNTGHRYPDFYKEESVLDAKYKRLGDYSRVAEVGSDDIHQVITYMTRLHAPKGGFVAPLQLPQRAVPTSRIKESDFTLSIFGIQIAKNSSSYTDFCSAMKENERLFISSLRNFRIGIAG